MLDWSELPGRLFVVSGPSGSGKSTLVRCAVLRPEARAFLSISATTRPPRPGEVAGIDYMFLTREEFVSERDRGGFLESAEVHGNLYGTPVSPVEEHLRRGENVVLEIDVQGAAQVREKAPSAVLVFVKAPNLEVLESRLRGRGTEDEDVIQRRLVNARGELEQIPRFSRVIVNDNLDQAVEDLVAILAQRPNGGSDPHAG